VRSRYTGTISVLGRGATSSPGAVPTFTIIVAIQMAEQDIISATEVRAAGGLDIEKGQLNRTSSEPWTFPLRPTRGQHIEGPLIQNVNEVLDVGGWTKRSEKRDLFNNEIFNKARDMNASGKYFFNSFSHLQTFLLLRLQDEIAKLEKKLHDSVKGKGVWIDNDSVDLNNKLQQYCNPRSTF